jgi:hypothetical protein
MVKVLFCTFAGEVLRPALIVSRYPALQRVRVLMLDTGKHCHVHPNSIQGDAP